jgi:hypothetical protein
MPDSVQYPEGRVEVSRDGSIIIVTVIGWLTEELTKHLQKEVEQELTCSDSSSILYDGLYMNDPSLTLTLLMQSFHEKMKAHIDKSAIVVPGYRLAFLSRLAFGKYEDLYRVFYNDREEAFRWLNE